MNTVILGMGNTLLSDDAIGILVVRNLKRILGQINNLAIKETSWGGFAIIDLLSNYDYAIVIDSILTQKKPAGFIHYLKPRDLMPTLRLNSYHDINFITAIKFAEQFNAKMPSDIDIFAVEIEDSRTIQENLTPKVFNTIYDCTLLIISQLIEKKILPQEFNIKKTGQILSDKELKLLYDDSYTENNFSIHQNQQVQI